MRIKTMTPAMIAALFPPKPKPEEEEVSLADRLTEAAEVPPPAPPEPELQPPRVSLVDILREQHAREQRAAGAFNPLGFGRMQPPAGLFGNQAGPAPATMEARRFGAGSSSLSTPSTGFNLQQPLHADPVRTAPHSIEQSQFTQANFGNLRQDERRRYPFDFPPFEVPPLGFPSSPWDQSPWVMHARAPAGNDIEPDQHRDRASGPGTTQPPSSEPVLVAPGGPQEASASLPKTSFRISGWNEAPSGKPVGIARPNPSNRQQPGPISDRTGSYQVPAKQGAIASSASQTAAVQRMGGAPSASKGAVLRRPTQTQPASGPASPGPSATQQTSAVQRSNLPLPSYAGRGRDGKIYLSRLPTREDANRWVSVWAR
jgi:hypothetical protein